LSYVLEAYPLEYEFEDSEVVAISVKERHLGRVLSYLSKRELLRSQPVRHSFKAQQYRVYVISDLEELDELRSNYEVEVEEKVPLGSLPDYTKAEIAYVALRSYLYRSGFRRGAGSKLYNPAEASTPPDLRGVGVELYKAVVTGLDVLNGSSYFFVDAARKVEFTRSLRELEHSDPNIVRSFRWLKVLGSTTSFLVYDGVKLEELPEEVLNEAEAVARRVLKYLTETGRIDRDLAGVSSSDLYEYGLVPKSTRLRRELLGEGLLLMIPGRNVKVLFLPRSVLAPVPSNDNLRRILPDAPAKVLEESRLPPSRRHEEIKAFVVGRLSQVKTFAGLRVSVNPEPLEEVNVMRIKRIYVEEPRKQLNFSYFTRWDPCSKLRQYNGKLRLYLLDIGGDGSDVALIKRDLDSILQSGVISMRFASKGELLKNIGGIVGEVLKSGEPYRAVLVLGPPDADESEDKDLSNRIEYEFSSRGIFCRYLSRVVRGKGSSKDLLRRSLPHKVRTVLKALAIALGNFSHRLKPLEIQAKLGAKHVVSRIVGIDATTIGMEKGVLRVATAILVVDIAGEFFKLEALVRLSDEGEDAVIAETMEHVVGRFTSDGEPLLVYVNRARPETLVSYYLDGNTAREVLRKAIVVGATKTHGYSRILKATDIGRLRMVNPEVGIYYRLREKEEVNVAGERARLSRYLAVTTTTPGGGFTDLTIRPVLFTIIAGGAYGEAKHLERAVLDYSVTLCAVNNTSVWMHSLPWPLHEVNRKLRTAHRLARDEKEVVELLQNKDVLRVL